MAKIAASGLKKEFLGTLSATSIRNLTLEKGETLKFLREDIREPRVETDANGNERTIYSSSLIYETSKGESVRIGLRDYHRFKVVEGEKKLAIEDDAEGRDVVEIASTITITDSEDSMFNGRLVYPFTAYYSADRKALQEGKINFAELVERGPEKRDIKPVQDYSAKFAY